MFKKLFSAFGAPDADADVEPTVAAIAPAARSPYAPYESENANFIYKLLFCDDPSLFKPRPGATPTPWQEALFAVEPDVAALGALATNTAQEGRIRYLACARLRELGKPVPKKVLLGAIVEAAHPGGVDALAVYAEGGVRYVNQTGDLVLIEHAGAFAAPVQELLTMSQLALTHIWPTRVLRRPPPKAGQMRVTFLVSDGVYMGEGSRRKMQADAMAGPVISAANLLLLEAVAAATNKKPA